MKFVLFLTLCTSWASGQYYGAYPSSPVWYGNPVPSYDYFPPPNPSTYRAVGCGETRDVYPASRVVGGRKAMTNEFPWQVAVEMKNKEGNDSRQYCGGTIIAPNWILTAAHCVQGMNIDRLESEVGDIDLDSNDLTKVRFEDIIIHQDYDNKTMRNDIALIRTSEKIPFDRMDSEVEINSVCLPNVQERFKGRATVSGFGFLEEGGGKGTTEMRATEVLLLPESLCQDVYDTFDPEIMVCAGWPDGGHDACQGDSGGPLVQKQTMGNSVLVGVVSFGKGCARKDLPGIYTRVSAFIPWIESHIVSS